MEECSIYLSSCERVEGGGVTERWQSQTVEFL